MAMNESRRRMSSYVDECDDVGDGDPGDGDAGDGESLGAGNVIVGVPAVAGVALADGRFGAAALAGS
jgi:hypothetical protein